MKKNISLVLSTYNGSKYIEEQLNSLYMQTCRIDEVIICDDCSTDSTVSIVNNFILKRGIDNWKVIVNDKNIGWKQNFVNGIRKASGDFIFLCDQDDIWKLNKIQIMVENMNKNEQILLLASKYDLLIDGKIKKSSLQKKDFVAKKYISNGNILHAVMPGCTYCLRKELVKYYDVYWNNDIPHDAFVWNVAYAKSGLYYIDYPLIIYRRHSNTVTGRKISSKKDRIDAINIQKKYFKIYDIESIENPLINTQIKKIKKCLKNRENVLINHSLVSLIKNLRYIDYYWSWQTYVMDFFISFM